MTDTFFSSEVLTQEVEFDRIAPRRSDRPRKERLEWLQSCIVAAAVTIVAAGSVAFHFSPVGTSELVFSVGLEEESPGGLVSPPLAPSVRAQAEQFRRMFVVVPETEADRTITPDYDL